MLLLNANNTL